MYTYMAQPFLEDMGKEAGKTGQRHEDGGKHGVLRGMSQTCEYMRRGWRWRGEGGWLHGEGPM